MTTQTWHVPEDRLAAYLGGGLTAIEDASVEQHLLACASCRAGIRSLSDAPRSTTPGTTWTAIVAPAAGRAAARAAVRSG